MSEPALSTRKGLKKKKDEVIADYFKLFVGMSNRNAAVLTELK